MDIATSMRHPELFSRIIALDSALNKPAFLGSVNERTWDLLQRRNYETMVKPLPYKKPNPR